MDLTEQQSDALSELINIGYARAAGALSELTGHRITLEVPQLAIHNIQEIAVLLKSVLKGEVASVHQVFSGPVSGTALLLLDEAAALLLNRLLTENASVTTLDAGAREVITEVGNILLNACLGVFGNLLRVHVSFAVPHLQVDSIEEVLGSTLVGKEELRYALMIHTRFRLRNSDFSGYLVIILGIVSLERLLTELQAWEGRQMQG